MKRSQENNRLRIAVLFTAEFRPSGRQPKATASRPNETVSPVSSS